nr:MAG TPA: hypothetical protein [Caudoviricetes sp.]
MSCWLVKLLNLNQIIKIMKGTSFFLEYYIVKI